MANLRPIPLPAGPTLAGGVPATSLANLAQALQAQNNQGLQSALAQSQKNVMQAGQNYNTLRQLMGGTTPFSNYLPINYPHGGGGGGGGGGPDSQNSPLLDPFRAALGVGSNAATPFNPSNPFNIATPQGGWQVSPSGGPSGGGGGSWGGGGVTGSTGFATTDMGGGYTPVGPEAVATGPEFTPSGTTPEEVGTASNGGSSYDPVAAMGQWGLSPQDFGVTPAQVAAASAKPSPEGSGATFTPGGAGTDVNVLGQGTGANVMNYDPLVTAQAALLGISPQQLMAQMNQGQPSADQQASADTGSDPSILGGF